MAENKGGCCCGCIGAKPAGDKPAQDKKDDKQARSITTSSSRSITQFPMYIPTTISPPVESMNIVVTC